MARWLVNDVGNTLEDRLRGVGARKSGDVIVAVEFTSLAMAAALVTGCGEEASGKDGAWALG